jgi:hypothetical protein
MYRLGLNDLDAAIAVARKGSFRAAAFDLGMSTTAPAEDPSAARWPGNSARQLTSLTQG